MFWKFRQNNNRSEETAERPQSAQSKERSPREMMKRQIRELGASESLSYRLNESYGGGNRTAIVELDAKSTGKDRGYILSVDIVIDEKPAGAKTCVKKCKDPGEIADWIHKYRSNNHS